MTQGTDTRLGKLSTVFGLLAGASVVWLWVLTVGTSFNPPDWVRVVGAAGLPVGLVGSLVTGLSARHDRDRSWAYTGLFLAVVTVVGFFVLMAANG